MTHDTAYSSHGNSESTDRRGIICMTVDDHDIHVNSREHSRNSGDAQVQHLPRGDAVERKHESSPPCKPDVDFPFSRVNIIQGLFESEKAPSLVQLAEPAVARLDQWIYRGVGRRPKDWIRRDALLSRADRIKVTWPMREKAFAGEVPLCDARMSKQWARVRAFQLLHIAQLYGLQKAVNDQDSAEYRLLNKLLGCPPTGILVATSAGYRPSGRDVCRHARLCPFCFSRMAEEVYFQSRRILDRRTQDKLLVQIMCEVGDSDLPHVIVGLPLQRRVRLLRSRLMSKLRLVAQQLGIAGGIQTFQVSPVYPEHLAWDFCDDSYLAPRGYRYVFGLLGSVETPTDYLWNLMEEDEKPDIWIRGHGHETRCETTPIHRPITQPSALRSLIVGTSPTYTGADGPVERGVMSYEPWLLANYQQWSEHRLATKGMPLYQFFGSWESKEHRTGAFRKRLPNQLRLQQSRERSLLRTNRLRRFRPTIVNVIQDLKTQLGKLPGRQRLQQELLRRHIGISERDVRQLLSDYRN